MAAITNPTNLTPPRVPLIDDRTGAISREWYRFFLSLLTATQSSENEESLAVDTNALLASFDAAFNDFAQATAAQPDASAAVASLDSKVDDLAQSLATAPRQELGTMAALQQDNVPWVKFDTTPTGYPTGAAANGTLYWDDADGIKTLNLVMEDSGGVIQQIGEETYYRIKASANITNGQAVMFTGTVGASGGLTGAPATGLTATQSEYIMGVATQDIAHNSWGYVTWFGLVRNINTSGAPYGETWNAGDILYYNPAYAGGLTKTVPAAPNPKVIVGAVIYASAANGSLFIRPTFGSAFGATDSNVQITSLADGDIIQYYAAGGYWRNIPVVGGTGNLRSGTYTPTSFNTTNISASTPQSAQYMRVGNTVTVSGQIDITPTATGFSILGLSLPVASSLTSAVQLSGVFNCPDAAGGGVYADAANDRATFQMNASTTSNLTYYYTFTYRVL